MALNNLLNSQKDVGVILLLLNWTWIKKLNSIKNGTCPGLNASGRGNMWIPLAALMHVKLSQKLSKTYNCFFFNFITNQEKTKRCVPTVSSLSCINIQAHYWYTYIYGWIIFYEKSSEIMSSLNLLNLLSESSKNNYIAMELCAQDCIGTVKGMKFELLLMVRKGSLWIFPSQA